MSLWKPLLTGTFFKFEYIKASLVFLKNYHFVLFSLSLIKIGRTRLNFWALRFFLAWSDVLVQVIHALLSWVIWHLDWSLHALLLHLHCPVLSALGVQAHFPIPMKLFTQLSSFKLTSVWPSSPSTSVQHLTRFSAPISLKFSLLTVRRLP